MLLAAATMMINDAPPLQAGLVGLCGARYLMLRHSEHGPKPRMSQSAIAAGACFTVIAVSAASLPVNWPLLPVLVAPSMFLIYLAAIRPFLPGGAALQPILSHQPSSHL